MVTKNSVPLGLKCFSYNGPSIKRDKGFKIFILIFTFFIYMSYHLSRKPISIVKNVLHQNGSSWKPFDDENYGELLGSLDYAFLFSYAIGMFFSGHIAERIDLRHFLSIGLILSGIFTALFGMARYWSIHNLIYFLAVQIICGFVQSSGWPAVVTCVANWYGRGNRGLVMGIWNSHAALGNILGSLIAGYYVNTNWGLSFLIPALFPVCTGILCHFFLVPTPEDVNCTNPNKLCAPFAEIETSIDTEGHIQTSEHAVDHHTTYRDIGGRGGQGGRTGVNSDYGTADYEDGDDESPLLDTPVTFTAALRIPGVIEFSACLFFAKMISYTFLFWLPSYIRSTMPHLKNMEYAADLSTLFDFGGIAGGIIAGVVSDRTNSPAVICEVMFILAAPVMFIYQQYGHVSTALNISLLLLSGVLVNGPYALITTAVSADLGTHPALQGSGKALATVTAIIDGTGSMGAALGPLLTGLISPYGWNNVFYMLIAADIIAFIMLLRLVKKEITGFLTMRNLTD